MISPLRSKFWEIFEEKSIIGVIHLPPLLGTQGHEDMNIVLQKAKEDLLALEEGGAHGALIENEYDHPHTPTINKAQLASFVVVAKELADLSSIPLGIGVLLNDYEAALSIAKVCEARFIRLDVFVDTVLSKWGYVLKGKPRKVMEFKEKIRANLAIFTDVHVKLTQILGRKSISESAKEAVEHGSDAVIVTGAKTGVPPSPAKLLTVRRAIGDFPVLIGSGLRASNAKKLLQYADGAIVGTSLLGKDGKIDAGKVKKLIMVARTSKK